LLPREGFNLLCCALMCCAVLCCAMLCCAVLWEGCKLLRYYNRVIEDQAWLATNQYQLQVCVLQVEGPAPLHYAAETGTQASMFLIEHHNQTDEKGSP